MPPRNALSLLIYSGGITREPAAIGYQIVPIQQSVSRQRLIGIRNRELVNLEHDLEQIIIVSGLPRSGTSLMMQILQRAGIPLLTDDSRPPDVNNRNGYFEFEPVKSLPANVSWLPLARGKAVKIISHLLYYLPDTFQYKIIFMNRNLNEIIQSQNKMLKNLSKPQGGLSIEALTRQFNKHLDDIHDWLRKQNNIQVLNIPFARLIEHPAPKLQAVAEFLEVDFNIAKLREVIIPELYRNRSNS